MFSFPRTKLAVRAPRRSTRLRVEALEPRQLLANALEAVTFQGKGFTPVYADPTIVAGKATNGTKFDGPQWTPQHPNPVSYTVGSTMTLTAVVKLNPAPAAGAKVMIQGLGPDGVTVPAANAVPQGAAGGGLYAVYDDQSTPLGMTVRYYNPFTITWESSTDGGKTWQVDGQSKDKLFLTLAKPVGTAWLTVIQTSTIGASGVTLGAGALAQAQDAAVPGIWAQFQTLNMHRAVPQPGNGQGPLLTYYNNYRTTSVMLNQLLATTDGQCYAWAQFMLSALRMQGINQAGSYINVQPSHGGGFLVNNWTFGAQTKPGTPYPYWNIPNLGGGGYIGQNSYNWISAAVTQGNGVAGQGNPSPASFFTNHQILSYTIQSGANKGKVVYYDPSYGLTYTSPADMAKKALAGYYIARNVRIKGRLTLVFEIQKLAGSANTLKFRRFTFR